MSSRGTEVSSSGRRACGIDITNNCRPERLSQESVHSKLSPPNSWPISYGAPLFARVPYSRSPRTRTQSRKVQGYNAPKRILEDPVFSSCENGLLLEQLVLSASVSILGVSKGFWKQILPLSINPWTAIVAQLLAAFKAVAKMSRHRLSEN